MSEYRDVQDPLALAIAERMPKSMDDGSFTVNEGLLVLADRDFGKLINAIVERATFIGAEIILHVEKVGRIESFEGDHIRNVLNTTVNWSR